MPMNVYKYTTIYTNDEWINRTSAFPNVESLLKTNQTLRGVQSSH